MFSRRKVHENVDPLRRGVAAKKGHVVNGQEAALKAVQIGKVKKVGVGQNNKRAAFGDLTNATKENGGGAEVKKKVIAKAQTKTTSIPVKSSKTRAVKKATDKKDATTSYQCSQESIEDVSSYTSDSLVSSQESNPDSQPIIVDTRSHDEELNEEDCPEASETFVFEGELVAFDKKHYDDVSHVGRYAQDIFDYYKRRERMFPIPDYMSNGKHQINPGMRAILVDWMVDVQENFELNHETLYLAVKLTDLYLSIVDVQKENLQLVGAAAIFISAKFDERFPPLIEDFTYVCDNAFDRQEFLEMEMELLRRVDYDIGIPISYRFLRRYAKIAELTMPTLTLARYILELSLMEYAFVMETDSKIAAAALIIAMQMVSEGNWAGDVVRSSGYTRKSLTNVITKLNKMLLEPPISQLSTIRSKYSHKVFHEVAKIKVLPTNVILS